MDDRETLINRVRMVSECVEQAGFREILLEAIQALEEYHKHVCAAPLPSIVVVKTDGWEGLWVDGVLKTEDESIRLEDLTTYVPNLDLTEVWDESKDLRMQMQDEGYFPDDYVPEPLRKIAGEDTSGGGNESAIGEK